MVEGGRLPLAGTESASGDVEGAILLLLRVLLGVLAVRVPAGCASADVKEG